MKLSHKRFGIKSLGDTGEVSAEIATLNVKDKDDDVTLPGFFGEQDVKIVLSHQWGPVMLGKGKISEQDEKAVLDGKMNLDEADAEARAVHSRLKFDLDNPPPLIEWSYGFELKTGAREQFTDDEKFGDGYWLKPMSDGSPGAKIFEASPVLVGAGEGTGTTSVKSAGQTLSILDALAELGDDEAKQLLELHNLLDLNQEDQKFIDQLDRTLAAVVAVQKRAEEITDERPLGRDSAERTREIAEALLEAEKKLRGVTVDTDLGLALPTERELALMLAQTEARITGRAYARTNN